MITHYDLFAGIGGFSLALDTVFYDQETKHIFCEWQAFPTAVLRKHWPDATYFGDIADLVTYTKGIQQQQLAVERKPYKKATLSESVGDIESTSADTQLPRLERCEQNKATGHNGQCSGERSDQTKDLTILTGGFPCQPFSHAGRRQGTADDRYKWPEMFAVIRNVRPDWVIAENVRGLVTWNDGMVLETVCSDLEREGYEVQPFVVPACAVGAPHRRDRVWIIANYRREYGEQGHSQRMETSPTIGTTCSKTNQRGSEYPWPEDWREIALTTCHDGVDDGLPRWMDGIAISASKHRKERLKACGNAIVPQVAVEIFKSIKYS